MGTSGQWLVVRGPAGGIEEREIEAGGMRILGEREGWSWVEARYADWIEVLTPRIGRIAGQPALGAFVHDSDFGLVVGATADGEIAFRFPINEFPTEESDLDNVWLPDEHPSFGPIPKSPDARRSVAEELERWSSQYAPRRVAADELLAAMPDGTKKPEPSDGVFFGSPLWHRRPHERDSEGPTRWVFADDGVRLVFNRLGVGVEL